MERNKNRANGRERWNSRLLFILATMGWSVGIGNVWRFPYIAGEYGGAVFIVVYLILLFLVAIPLFIGA